MPRVLDLNEVQSSFMDLVLRDDARTVVHLEIPTEQLVNELQNMQGKLAGMRTGDQNAVAAIYDLMASLVNCNQDFFKTTGAELAGKYRMYPAVALKFFSEYLRYIEELANAKN